MSTLSPYFSVEITRREQSIGIQSASPVWWHSAAPQWNEESGTAVDGRYHESAQEAQGKSYPVYADTYITGQSGTGRAFTAVTGSWNSKVVLPDYGSKFGCFFADSTANASFEILETAVHATTGITNQLMVLRRGLKPSTVTDQDQVYTYIELANGDTSNYRLSFPWADSPQLDYYDPTQGKWLVGVDVCKRISNCSEYFAQNRDEMRIKVQPDNVRNIMHIELGNNNWLSHAPSRNMITTTGYITNPNNTNPLPQNERIRVYGKNGWCQFYTLALNFKPLVVAKSPKKIPDSVTNVQGASVSINGLGRDDKKLQTTFTPNLDQNNYLSYTATVTSTDPANPPTASDIFFYIPSEYSQPIIGVSAPAVYPPLIRVEEHEVFDDITRFVSRSATLIIDNQSGAYTGSFGNFSANMFCSNGTVSAQRLRGMMVGGFTAYGPAGAHLVQAHLEDDSYILKKAAIRQEVAFDRWALPGAVHGCLDLSQIPPQLRQSIPFWPPGPASYDCPFPILPAGTGNNPLLRYFPETKGIQIFLDLLQDGIPDPVTGANVPLVGGTNEYGQWFFDTYDPRQLNVSATFTDYDDTGYRAIQEISVYDSVDEMRTDLDFMGQDPYTGELLYLHVPLSWNVNTISFHDGWAERNGRWCSPAYLERIAKSAAVMASIPTTNVVITVPYDPTIHVGQLVYIYERSKLGGGDYFIILQTHSALGAIDPVNSDGTQECRMQIVARLARNLSPY